LDFLGKPRKNLKSLQGKVRGLSKIFHIFDNSLTLPCKDLPFFRSRSVLIGFDQNLVDRRSISDRDVADQHDRDVDVDV